MLKKSIMAFVVISVLILSVITFSNKGIAKGIHEVENYDSIESINNSYIYFGRPTCTYCEAFYPSLEKSVSDNNISLTYVNTDKISSEEDMERIIEEYNIEYVPYLVQIENGNISKIFEDTNTNNPESTLKNLELFFK